MKWNILVGKGGRITYRNQEVKNDECKNIELI